MTDTLASALGQLRSGADEVIETSCAYVFLKGDHAYKIKKSVDFGFLDFTSAEKRATAIHRELVFNKRLASDIYLNVEDICGESVLVMRRFDTASVLAAIAETTGSLNMELMQSLGRTIAHFHADADVCRDASHADNIAYVITTSRANIELFKVGLGQGAVAAYDAAISAASDRNCSRLLRRFEQGFVRHCHGDMHLGNILVERGQPVLFDCIEFNDKLSQIDVLYDLAFLLMDLCVRERPDAANQVMNTWLEQAARLEASAAHVYQSLELLPFYMSIRAAVRCHVSAHQGDLNLARTYLSAAQSFLAPKPPELMAIGGLSGAGKSTRARDEAPHFGRAPGAVILRSDETRKRLWACPGLSPLPPEAYTPEASAKVLGEMCALGDVALSVGESLILDATFRDAAWRQAAEGLATDKAADFVGVWLDVPAEERAQRLATRSGDVSDATEMVALMQSAPTDLSALWRVDKTRKS